MDDKKVAPDAVPPEANQTLDAPDESVGTAPPPEPMKEQVLARIPFNDGSNMIIAIDANAHLSIEVGTGDQLIWGSETMPDLFSEAVGKGFDMCPRSDLEHQALLFQESMVAMKAKYEKELGKEISLREASVDRVAR